jgi:hypothetical protein
MESQSTLKRPREDDLTLGDTRISQAEQPAKAKRPRPITDQTMPTSTTLQRYIVIHRVTCTGKDRVHESHSGDAYFLDVPYLPAGSNKTSRLKGQTQLQDINSYLDENNDVSFAVYIVYSCNSYHDEIKDTFERLPMPQMDPGIGSQARPFFFLLKENSKLATSISEEMTVSKGLREALQALSKVHPGSLGGWDASPANLKAPYLHLHHCRDLFTGNPTIKLNQTHQRHLEALSEYFDNNFSP